MSLLNTKAPPFTLPSTEGIDLSLSDYEGQKVLLVFYPGDDTPVCTKQLCSYASGFEEFIDKNIQIIGINKDSVDSHKKFKKKHNFPFPLLSDTTGKVCSSYGANGLLGTKRATYLINENGIIIYEDSIFPFFFRDKTEILNVINSFI